MLTKNDVGKKIIMFRKPTNEDWGKCNSVNTNHWLGKETFLEGWRGAPYENCILIKCPYSYIYPACCFRLVEEFPDYEVY